MCISFLWVAPSTPDGVKGGEKEYPYDLIIASNRDEYLSREATEPYCWGSAALAASKNGAAVSHTKISTDSRARWDKECDPMAHRYTFAGRDMKSGGTWLGIRARHIPTPVQLSRSGSKATSAEAPGVPSWRFGLITNHREVKKQQGSADLPSRGKLIAEFLASDPETNFTGNVTDAQTYADALQSSPGLQDFPGFNLLLGDRKGIYYVSNRGVASDTATKLSPGVHGVSNGVLDDHWPKVVSGKERFARAVNRHLNSGPKGSVGGEGLLVDDLLALMNDETTMETKGLPGVFPANVETSLSSVCVKPFQIGTQNNDLYGTRNNYVILVRKNGQVSMFHSSKQHSPARMETERLVFNPLLTT